MLPTSKPKITSDEAMKIAKRLFGDALPEVCLIAVRGYYSNTFGDAGNDINVYDDAMLVLASGKLIATFNANTDPSKRKANLAMLNEGIYTFYRGSHKGRIDAFRAFPEGTKWQCKRQDSKGNWYQDLCSHINIHDGGLNDTWSAGCTTLPNWRGQKQFDTFRNLVYALMKKHDMKVIYYALINEPQMQEYLRN